MLINEEGEGAPSRPEAFLFCGEKYAVWVLSQLKVESSTGRGVL